MLRNVDLTTSGKFRCEVSGEAPLFQTATHTNVLIVVGKFPKKSSVSLCIIVVLLDCLSVNFGFQAHSEFSVLGFEEVLTSQNFICRRTENVH